MTHPSDFVAYPLTFEPEVLVKVWGGTKLAEVFGKPESKDPLGESWEVSAVEGHESVVASGPMVMRMRRNIQCPRLLV